MILSTFRKNQKCNLPNIASSHFYSRVREQQLSRLLNDIIALKCLFLWHRILLVITQFENIYVMQHNVTHFIFQKILSKLF